MNRENLDSWCERGILALVLAILVFGPLALGAVDTLQFLIIQGLTAGVMLLWGARIWLSPRPQLLWPPICWAVVAFAVYAIFRYLTADIEYIARQELLRVLVYAFLFLAILNNLHRQESTQIISFTLIFLAMGISFYAIFQFLTDGHRVWVYLKHYEHRGSGTYLSPNHLGGFLEMLLPLGLAYTLLSRLKPVAKIFFGYAALVILAGIAVTVSRGSWISTILALGIFFGAIWFHGSHRLTAALLLVLMIGASALLAPRSMTFKTRTRQLVTEGRIDDDKRFELWRPAFRLWQENPWWGVGPAHFDVRFRQYRPESVQERPEWVHNDYLNTLTEWGFVGMALVATALVLLGLGLIKTWPFVRSTARDLGEKKRSNKFAFVLGAAVGLAAILIHSVVDFNMHIPANAILAVTLMALLSSHLRFATERYWKTPGIPLKVLASALLLSGVAFLTERGIQRAREYALLKHAGRARAFSPAKVKRLKMAYSVEPRNPETSYLIGDSLRVQSLDGGDNYQNLAQEAMECFARGTNLNRWDARNFLHYGMCLDWLDRTSESAPYFQKAELLDPNGYFTHLNIGWHYVQLGNYAAAKPWFERSLRLQWENNMTAQNYLKIANDRLIDAATNEISAKLAFPAQ
jgi:O-antigen ligase